MYDASTVKSLEGENLAALGTAVGERSDPFIDCYTAVQQYSEYGEIFLLRQSECFTASESTFMYVEREQCIV